MFKGKSLRKKMAAGVFGLLLLAASFLPAISAYAAINVDNSTTKALPFRQSVETTEKLIDSVHNLGFNTIRIPVTLGTMIDDKNGYALNEAWISCVQDIVDYYISQDIYVIIDIYHDGAEQSGWLRFGADDNDPVYVKFQGVWKNIAERFKNYDEHLIFESMNEIKSGDDSQTGRIKDMGSTLGKTIYSYENATTLATSFQKLANTFTSKGIPVFLGKYGCINKDNPIEWASHVESINRSWQMDGAVPCYWDQGWYDRTIMPDYSYALVDWTTGEAIDKDVTDAIMRGLFVKAQTNNLSDVVKQTLVVLISSTTNEVLLWKTADSSVATVYNGQVRGHGIGTTVLRAFSQSDFLKKTVSITVNTVDSEKPCTKIATDKDTYDLTAGQSVYLNVKEKPSDTTDFIIYKSNKDIVTVSTQGKIVAKSALKASGTSDVTVSVKEVVTGDTSQPLADEDLIIEKKTGIEKYIPIIEITIVGILIIVAFGTGTYHITKRVKRDKK